MGACRLDSDDEAEVSVPSPLRHKEANFDELVLGGPGCPEGQLDEFMSHPGSVDLDPVQCDIRVWCN